MPADPIDLAVQLTLDIEEGKIVQRRRIAERAEALAVAHLDGKHTMSEVAALVTRRLLDVGWTPEQVHGAGIKYDSVRSAVAATRQVRALN